MKVTKSEPRLISTEMDNNTKEAEGAFVMENSSSSSLKSTKRCYVDSTNRVRPQKYRRRFTKLKGNSSASSLCNQEKRQECNDVSVITGSDRNILNNHEQCSDKDFQEEGTSIDTHDELESVSVDKQDICNPFSLNGEEELVPIDNEDEHVPDHSQVELELINHLKCQEDKLFEELIDSSTSHAEKDNEPEGDEEETEIHDVETNEPMLDMPLQPGHSLTTQVAVLIVWMYCISHSLTAPEMSSLLTLINIFLLHQNPAFKSLHRFRSFFKSRQSSWKKYYFCVYCSSSVKEDDDICTNDKCRKQLSLTKRKQHFIMLDIQSQLQNLFGRKDFCEGLNHRFERSKKNQNNIEDIFDSEEYKKLENGPMKDRNNLTFTLNTDGVPVFKSSKTSMWPVYLMVNELPFKMRKSREYMIMAGLWCGTSKPDMNVFLSPVLDLFKDLEKGISIKIDSEITTVKGFLYAVSCDLPARSSVLNINNHNGEYSCIKCSQPGINHRTASGGNIRIFPFSVENPDGPSRSHDDVLECARKASIADKVLVVEGIKGPSALMFAPKFDCVKGVVIDYMHLVCLGVGRTLLRLWFDVSNSLNDFSLYKYVEIIDEKLTAMKPPHFITRMPRSIKDNMKFWKAAELRSWLFYYSIPCIRGILQPKYFYHYCAFIEGIYLLSKSSISEEDLVKSERLLRYFVFVFQDLYDKRYMTLNMHCLLHLSKNVRDLGPLWALSCFSFESANGELLQLFHGTQHVDIQITNAIHIFQLLPTLSENVSVNSVAASFLQSLSKSKCNYSNKMFYLIGKSYDKTLNNQCKSMLSNMFKGVNISFLFYKRASVRGVMFHSMDYTRVTKRISYCIQYLNGNCVCYGFVLWFAESKDDKQTAYACVQTLSKKQVDIFETSSENEPTDQYVKQNFMSITLPWVRFVDVKPELHLIEVGDITDLCMCIQCGENSYILCIEPNHNEHNL